MNHCFRLVHFISGLCLVSAISGCAQPVTRTTRQATTINDALAQSDAATAQQASSLAAIAQARLIVATNLANAQTIGFKRVTATAGADGRTSVGIDPEQGSIDRTDRPLDVAISGSGFFAVKDATSPERIAYTRNGNFFVAQDGSLVLGIDGRFALQPSILIPANVSDIAIAEDGTITVLTNGEATKRVVGQIKLTMFIDPHSLHPASQPGLYTATDLSGRPVTTASGEGSNGKLLQGFLEASNVDVQRERLRIEFLDEWRDATVAVSKR